jgi:hypothetical protein
MKQRSQLGISQTVDVLSSLVGEYIWSVRCVDDRILRLDFGNPRLVIHEPRNATTTSDAVFNALSRRVVTPRGRWHLFVEDGAWSVSANKFHCGRFDCDQLNIEKCLGQLDGQKLISVNYIHADQYWVFKFDLSGELIIKNYLEFNNNSQWIIFSEEGWHLSFVKPDNIVIETSVYAKIVK